ncbi:isocitrate lyase/phosphoenolpyruvate mutase family protein [Salinibacterium sp. TMP30]|uniref:isocitrate lyase/phosphoenolpyruvate mutase family protein n=1 Tax=Salinibacterium sp. TMP30 TaxID=3138237 RepID=UPI0031396A68
MATFRDLHYGDAPLLLPNAWDVGSALAFATAGLPAIGTTSFGVAGSAGIPDGGGATKAATVALLAQLCRLPVHVTADIEDGRLIDSTAFAAKVMAVKRRSPNVFVNARIDNLWLAALSSSSGCGRQQRHRPARRHTGAGRDPVLGDAGSSR